MYTHSQLYYTYANIVHVLVFGLIVTKIYHSHWKIGIQARKGAASKISKYFRMLCCNMYAVSKFAKFDRTLLYDILPTSRTYIGIFPVWFCIRYECIRYIYNFYMDRARSLNRYNTLLRLIVTLIFQDRFQVQMT